MEIKIVSKSGLVKAYSKDNENAQIVYNSEYEMGDSIHINIENINEFYSIQLDNCMGETDVYMKNREYIYEIPFGEKKSAICPSAFYGKLHHIFIRKKYSYINSYRNLCYNPYDVHNNYGCYPHASANVETRGEAVFAARNAIDGELANNAHGIWPFSSWGINKQKDARIQIDFGRTVIIDRICIWTRADFPHDSWWEGGVLEFSDGTSKNICLTKTKDRQVFNIESREVSWIALSNLKKASDESPFPALTQIKAYGLDK